MPAERWREDEKCLVAAEALLDGAKHSLVDEAALEVRANALSDDDEANMAVGGRERCGGRRGRGPYSESGWRS